MRLCAFFEVRRCTGAVMRPGADERACASFGQKRAASQPTVEVVMATRVGHNRRDKPDQ